MKKISLMLVTIVLFLFLVASCHGRLVPKDDIQTVKDFEVPETFDESKDIQITFWAKNDTNKIQQEIF